QRRRHADAEPDQQQHAPPPRALQARGQVGGAVAAADGAWATRGFEAGHGSEAPRTTAAADPVAAWERDGPARSRRAGPQQSWTRAQLLTRAPAGIPAMA